MGPRCSGVRNKRNKNEGQIKKDYNASVKRKPNFKLLCTLCLLSLLTCEVAEPPKPFRAQQPHTHFEYSGTEIPLEPAEAMNSTVHMTHLHGYIDLQFEVPKGAKQSTRFTF